jgi:hypothetical protein
VPRYDVGNRAWLLETHDVEVSTTWSETLDQLDSLRPSTRPNKIVRTARAAGAGRKQRKMRAKRLVFIDETFTKII